MKILVADSGATKTDWALVGEESQEIIQTRGLNPHLVSSELLMEVVREEVLPDISLKEISEVRFYGAGCGDKSKNMEVRQSLQTIFSGIEIEVGTDLEAAGKALFGSGSGLVCILGTGSSAAFYENGSVIIQMPSYGYPKGDEGSGSYIGKQILESYLRKQLPEELRQYLETELDTRMKVLFQYLQVRSTAKKFVAVIGEKFGSKANHPFVKEIIETGIEKFLVKVKEYFPEQVKDYELGFVGSVAAFYEGAVRSSCEKQGIAAGRIIQSPVHQLIKETRKEIS